MTGDSPLSLKCPYENCNNPDWLSEEMLYRHMLMHHEAGEGLKLLAKLIVKLNEEKNEQDQDFDDEEDFQKWKKEYVDKLT